MVVIQFARFVPLCACALAACGGGRTALLDASRAESARPVPDLASPARDSARVVPDARPDLPADSGRDLARDLVPDLVPDLAPDLTRTTDLPLPNPTPGCAPTTETCNGVDDDCDGVVDNDIPPIPCPGGGFRYCVGGQMSACPTRCAVCVPGGQRVCFISYCTYWGQQTCAADGQSWSYCVERRPVPSACASVASNNKHSRETEQCCIDNGFCCLDEFDLNGNGDHNDLVGRCEDVLCAP